MNAYELADAVEDWETGANYTISIKAGQMLREQAKRIEELEKQIQDMAMDNLVAIGQEFENSAQLIGNKTTNYAKLKEEFE